MIILRKVVNSCKIFTEWGGLAGFVCYLIDGEIVKALIVALVLGVLAICYETFFKKLPP